jgi:hypothetical protein
MIFGCLVVSDVCNTRMSTSSKNSNSGAIVAVNTNNNYISFLSLLLKYILRKPAPTTA